MAEIHNGMLNRIYGRIDSDETFTKKLHHLQKVKRESGVDWQWYTNGLNQIMLKHNQKWYTYDELSYHFKVLRYSDS